MPPPAIDVNDQGTIQAAAMLSYIAYLDPYKDGTQGQYDAINNAVSNQKELTPGMKGPWKLIWGPATRAGILIFLAQAKDGTYALACRGTIGYNKHDVFHWLENIFDDLLVGPPVDWKYPPTTNQYGTAYVTWGDDEAFRSANDANGYKTNLQLMNVLAPIFSSQPGRIMVVGHSLGGGLANLLAVYLGYNFPGTQVVPFTFAAPTISNTVFASAVFETYIKSSYQLVNENDVIPMIWWNFHRFLNSYTPPDWYISALEWYSPALYGAASFVYGVLTVADYTFFRLPRSNGSFRRELTAGLDWGQQALEQHSLGKTYFPHVGLKAAPVPDIPVEEPSDPVVPTEVILKLKNKKVKISVVE